MENVAATPILDAIPGLIWSVRPDGRVDAVNQAWTDFTGLSVDELHSRDWPAVIHCDDMASFRERVRATVASGETVEIEVRLRRQDGLHRWHLFRIAPIPGAGEAGGWCGVGLDIDDRRRREDGLRVSEDHHALVDSIPALIAFMTPEGEVKSVNRHVLDYFGVATAQDFKDWATNESTHPDDLSAVVAAWSHSIATRDPFDVEQRLRRRDGIYRWFHVQGLPLTDGAGQVVGWHVLQTDIDDRKRAEARLAAENRLLEMVASDAPVFAVLEALCLRFEDIARDCTCSVVLVEASGSRLLQGASPSLPKTFTESIDGRPVSIEYGPCATACSLNEQVICADINLERRWGSSGWPTLALSHGLQAVWSTPIACKNGAVLGSFALHYDRPANPTSLHQDLIRQFTHIARVALERARAKDALKRSQTFLAEAQHLSRTGSFAWRVDSEFVTYSEQTSRIYGFDPAEPVTLDLIGARIHPEDMPLLHDMIEKARGPGSDLDYQYRLLMPDQTVKHLHLVAHGYDHGDGSLEYIGAIQDVTERHLSELALSKARSELEHVTRVMSLGALTASIAHEINQPLAGIVTNANTCMRMLAADPPNVLGALETARRTIRDGNRASEVVTRLRAMFGRREMMSEPVDLNDSVREVIALARTDLQRQGVLVTSLFAEPLPPVTGDRLQLQQVVMNLLLNAIEAMSHLQDRPSPIVIRTKHDEGGWVRLSLEDAGIGFGDMNLDQMFAPFYSTKAGGMGIGLAVSRTIVERHNGRLWATPNAERGVTFSFVLPASAPLQHGQGRPPAPAPAPRHPRSC